MAYHNIQQQIAFVETTLEVIARISKFFATLSPHFAEGTIIRLAKYFSGHSAKVFFLCTVCLHGTVLIGTERGKTNISFVVRQVC